MTIYFFLFTKLQFVKFIMLAPSPPNDKKTRVTAKNAIFAASAIHFLSILSILFQQNTIKFVKEEQTTIIMGNGNKNVNYYLAFVLCLRIIKTAEI